MKRILLALLFIIIILAGILSGGYTYLGVSGTNSAREELFVRGKLLGDPALPNERGYLTKDDLQSDSSDIAGQYKDSVRSGSVLAVQVDWDTAVMYLQSILLLTAGTAGLFALKRQDSG